MAKSLFVAIVAILAILIVVVSLSFHEKDTAQAGGGDTPTSIWVAVAPLEDNFTRAFRYEGRTKGWLWFAPKYGEIPSLRQLEVGKAYWFHVNQDQVVSLCGTQYNLEAGWNNIGWVKSC